MRREVVRFRSQIDPKFSKHKDWGMIPDYDDYSALRATKTDAPEFSRVALEIYSRQIAASSSQL